MFRLVLTTALLTAVLLPGDSATRADSFDSLINLELAFRDTTLEVPAPNRYQSLIRDGETTITFVGDFPGSVAKTDFFLNLDWSSRFSMDGQEKPSDQQMREGINHEIQRRQSAILDLLRANYVALDKVSQNGLSAMQDRKAFFESLYTQQNLEAVEFPFRKEVVSLLESESYRQLRPRQVPADPATLPLR